MRSTLRVLSIADSPDQFRQWRALPSFAKIDDHPLSGAFARRYYPLVFGRERRESSFAVVKDGMPELIALCSVGPGTVDYYGLPIALFGDAVGVGGSHVAVDKAFDYLATLAGSRRSVLISERALDSMSALGAACYQRGFVATRRFKGICNLSLGEAGLRAALRRRYRPMINWGRNNLRTAFVNASNPDASAFSQYQAFHKRIVGRSTRPQDTWDVMFNWIANGHGELVLGYFGADLVAGTMVVDGTTTSYYASGVYDRERFAKPIGHWPMHIAIVRSLARGMKYFEIGDIPAEGAVSAKEYNIGQFKKGFVTEIETWTNWARAGSAKDIEHADGTGNALAVSHANIVKD